ncbi:MarR family transcriptional regulator [Ramlibacter sp. XY19]|uniref:MarR family winged helix-turn-helix transcriptional regulator n=1 Tax=Ramlibacter paludis TaxID=2908000 RepID=UPI0023DB5E2C|nr:MarR family transcriptional regulator [Ramlibacter paludis]MCG2591554.1 MarR family transcriptional regulator [Ramlibacter paludis]
MARKKDEGAGDLDQGRMDEAMLHDLVGYQLAQAQIATLAVFYGSVGRPLDLRHVEYTVLALIKENPACTPARLAKELAVTAGNITMWVDRLVQRELVRREASVSDRRVQHLHVTPKGEALVTAATRQLLEGERKRITALSPAERALLVELLHKVATCRD